MPRRQAHHEQILSISLAITSKLALGADAPTREPGEQRAVRSQETFISIARPIP